MTATDDPIGGGPVEAGSPEAVTVEYATVMGFRPLLADLYSPSPAASASAPVIVYIHGGGWRVGSRREFSPAFKTWQPTPFHRLAAHGYAVLSIDYRLSGEARFPAQLEDVQAALGWVAAHADEFALDADRVILWGESAGGHLAALAGLSTPPAGVQIAGVIDWYGPANLTTMQRQQRPDAVTSPDAEDSRESLLLGAPLRDSEDLAAAASPVSFVHAAAPPFLIAHGVLDRFVPHQQSNELAEALTAQQVPVRLDLIDDADHMWLGSARLAEIFTAAVRFADESTGTPLIR